MCWSIFLCCMYQRCFLDVVVATASKDLRALKESLGEGVLSFMTLSFMLTI